MRVVVSLVSVVVASTDGGGPSTGTTGGGGTASEAWGPATIDSIGVAPVATPTPSTPVTVAATPSTDRLSTSGHRGAGRERAGRASAVVGAAAVTASSSLVTSG